MPIQIIQRRNTIGDAITQGTQGFLRGRDMRLQNEELSLARAFKEAQIRELNRKTEALNAPIEDPNYFRDPVTLKLIKKTQMQGGGGINPNLTPTKFDKYGNPKEYTDYETKALSGDAARSYSGAVQGLGNIENIKGEFGLSRDEMGNTEIAPDYKSKILGLKMAGYRNNPASTGPASMVSGFLIRNLAGKQARDLALQYDTLAENELRARTGAAATPSEIASVRSRMEPSITDRPENIYNRLDEPRKFLSVTADSVKPGTTKRMGLPLRQNAVPSWASKDPGRYTAAKKAGYGEEELKAWYSKNGLLS